MLCKLLQFNEKPPLYEKGTSIMWTDPHISKQLLEIHLNPELDLASRKHTTIKSTVNWILGQLSAKPARILDLGCGPGLYTELFASAGHHVTGIDFSENSIRYARERAGKLQLDIEYQCQNYLELEVGEKQYDLATMIYTDFGVLRPEERKILLNNVIRSLKPGGIFIFDVLNDRDLEKKVTPKGWDVVDSGFWKDRPYLWLYDSFLYKQQKVILNQHMVLDDSSDLNVYRFWTHYFSDNDVKKILESNGLKTISLHSDILPNDGLWSGHNVTFCIASS